MAEKIHYLDLLSAYEDTAYDNEIRELAIKLKVLEDRAELTLVALRRRMVTFLASIGALIGLFVSNKQMVANNLEVVEDNADLVFLPSTLVVLVFSVAVTGLGANLKAVHALGRQFSYIRDYKGSMSIQEWREKIYYQFDKLNVSKSRYDLSWWMLVGVFVFVVAVFVVIVLTVFSLRMMSG